jgi:hypothetical protein
VKNRFRVCLKRIDSAVLHVHFRSGRGDSVGLIAVFGSYLRFLFLFSSLSKDNRKSA